MDAGPAVGGAQIVTLTMNPALDITTGVDAVRPTDKLRCGTPRYDPGGGGINVARIAHVLGASVEAVFPAGGPTGDLLTSLVGAAGVPYRRVAIGGSTRESFTVNETGTGRQYRFVLPGPRLSDGERVWCLDELRSAAARADFVVASGSLPPGVPADHYQRVAEMCAELGVRLILDTSGGGLRHISSEVFLLKASGRELRECVGRPLTTDAEHLAAAHELLDTGRARTVLVSLGPRGALLATQHASLRFDAIPMSGGSGVGAGDAMVAAVAVGLVRGWPLVKSVRLGIAAGTAMLMTPGTAACDRADVERFFTLAGEPVDVAAAPQQRVAQRRAPAQ